MRPKYISAFAALLLVAMLCMVAHSAHASGDELTADWKAERECQGHTVFLFANPIPNGSMLNVQFYLALGEESPVGYGDIDLEVYDERGDKIPLKVPQGENQGKWGVVSINSLSGGSADGSYEMTLKPGRRPATARLTWRGEKWTFKFAVWRN